MHWRVISILIFMVPAPQFVSDIAVIGTAGTRRHHSRRVHMAATHLGRCGDITIDVNAEARPSVAADGMSKVELPFLSLETTRRIPVSAFSLWLKEDGDIRVQEPAGRNAEDIGECAADVTKAEIRCAIDNLCAGDIAVGALLSGIGIGILLPLLRLPNVKFSLSISPTLAHRNRHRSAEYQCSLHCRCLG